MLSSLANLNLTKGIRAIHLTQPTTTCSIGAGERSSFLMLLRLGRRYVSKIVRRHYLFGLHRVEIFVRPRYAFRGKPQIGLLG